MKSGEVPVFNLKKYEEATKIQTFRGIFYKAQRKVSTSENESLVDSSEISFSILIFNLNVPKQFKELQRQYTIETKVISNCREKSVLYYADKDIKVYTYCLEDIKLKENNKTKELLTYLKKDTDILNDIDSKLTYLGLYKDQSTLMFKDLDNFATNGLTMYRCHKTHINDVYIAPADTEFQPDFCTYKDDDFKFIYEIKEEPSTTSPTPEASPAPTKEAFYEDEVYRYEFDEIKSNRIFIITPAVRGVEEMRYPLKQVLTQKMLTIDELAAKGLKFNKIDKKKEQEELKKKALEEAKKQREQELAKSNQNLQQNNQ